MSEKVIEKEVQVIEKIHHFECDMCHTHIGESVEHEDGWYERKGLFSEHFRISGEEFTIQRHLCEICKIKFQTKIRAELMKLGFTWNGE